MSIYIQRDTDGAIVSWAKQPEIGHEAIDFDGELVRGYDEKFYKPDEVPAQPAPTLEDQLAAVEAKYEQNQAELDKALVAALRMGGAQEAAARAAIKQKSLKLIQDQNDEIDALSAQQNGG